MTHPRSEKSRLKWNRKYSDVPAVPDQPSRVLQSLKEWLPSHGRALDAAGGGGRNAIWLAQQGLDVTLADISTVGLKLAESRAAEAGVTIQTLEADLEQGPFPEGPWDLIFIHLFLWRPLLERAARQLSPAGRLIMIQPTKSNLERHEKPPFDFLLDDGELPELARAAGLEVLLSREGWDADHRHEAVLVAGCRS